MARPRGESRQANRAWRRWLAGVRNGTVKLPAAAPSDATAMAWLQRSARPVRRRVR